jgi:hypothetical protein
MSTGTATGTATEMAIGTLFGTGDNLPSLFLFLDYLIKNGAAWQTPHFFILQTIF